MEMFAHYYEFSSSPNPDRPEPMVVSIAALDDAALNALPTYLCESLSLRYDLQGIDTHLQGRPVVFEIGGTRRLSERAMWHLLIDGSGGAARACDYLSAVIDFTNENEDLGFYSFLDVIGQDPLYAYIERFAIDLTDGETKDSTDYLQVTDAFLRFLKRCDMDHETVQNEYINQVLSVLPDRARKIDLLMYRWTAGQYTDLAIEHIDCLFDNGTLKDVVDRIIEDELKRGEVFYSQLFKICRSVYGNHEQAVSEVLDYCKSKATLVEEPLDKYDERDLRWIDKYSIFRLNLYGGYCNTGFHAYDQELDEWRKLD